MEIVYGRTKEPEGNRGYVPVDLTEETMKEHLQKVLGKMEDDGLDTLLIYGASFGKAGHSRFGMSLPFTMSRVQAGLR